ncbi:unnamed protein product [Cuscuta epithymum]|uniref:Uncharacterized protein n=1 Tax=Cuscuta epithymum TaxID=186058 RepID=A0AAV0EM94_9ASTE|nr:unnamed protein product [Cuscuta epithymum]
MIDFEDEEFLSQVAAAEAAALSSSTKRRRTSTSNFTSTVNIRPATSQNCNDTTTTIGEGAYIAALKGSKSIEFQQQAATFSSSSVSRQSYKLGNHSNSSFPSSDSGNTCFKCGKSGHWARDCSAGPLNDGNDSASFPEKQCPCGSGNCIILTANTDKNRGRKFYKCPIRQDNGGCDFFEWCDKPSFTHHIAIQSKPSTNFSILELSCPCGAGPCLVLTAKTGKNIGQQFYRCPSQESCGFFKWCNEMTNIPEPQRAPQVNLSMGSMGNKSYNNSVACFKCGKEGHWAKECVNSVPLSSPGADGAGKSTTLTSCFKCGGAGHWAKDCTSAVSIRPPRSTK